ncbi:FAD-dependent oxidoreductase [bacterium]|nr:FAD-dependent oxidoreductase [bacterium]
MRRIAVIGGGVAGIAAALSASGRDTQVTLFESLPRLGGRAAGADGVDTGRHLVLSSYVYFLDLLKRLGSHDEIHFTPLHFTALDGDAGYELPFHTGVLSGALAAGFALMVRNFLPPASRAAAVTALARTAASAPGEPHDHQLAGDGKQRRFRRSGLISVDDLFDRLGWPEPLIERLGEPLALAMGNASSLDLAAGMYLNALARVLADTDPRSGWVTGERYGSVLSDPALWTLKGRGVDIRLGEGVRWVERTGDKWRIVSAIAERFDRVIITATPPRLNILDGVPEAAPLLAWSKRMTGRAILTIRARVYGPVQASGPIAETTPPHGIWFREWHPGGGVLLERVISNMANDSDLDLDHTIMSFAQHAQQWFNAKVNEENVVVRFYPDATMTVAPKMLRPTVRQGPGLYYASDLSATGLPATLESAARAGLLAGTLATTD